VNTGTGAQIENFRVWVAFLPRISVVVIVIVCTPVLRPAVWIFNPLTVTVVGPRPLYVAEWIVFEPSVTETFLIPEFDLTVIDGRLMVDPEL
jgi:hypothetical protein